MTGLPRDGRFHSDHGTGLSRHVLNPRSSPAGDVMGAVVKETEADTGPTFFSGSGYLVDEIELGIRVLSSKVKNLKEGNRNRAAVTQKLAAEEISKVAGQIKSMADTLSRVTVQHINRRPR